MRLLRQIRRVEMKDRIIDMLKKMRDENKYNQYKYMALE